MYYTSSEQGNSSSSESEKSPRFKEAQIKGFTKTDNSNPEAFKKKLSKY